MIKVMLVGNSFLMVEGVSSLLDSCSDIKVVGCATDAGEAVSKAEGLRPDIVIVDSGVCRSAVNGLIGWSRTAGSRAGVMLFTGFAEHPVPAVAGADAHMENHWGAGELAAQLRDLARRKRTNLPAGT